MSKASCQAGMSFEKIWGCLSRQRSLKPEVPAAFASISFFVSRSSVSRAAGRTVCHPCSDAFSSDHPSDLMTTRSTDHKLDDRNVILHTSAVFAIPQGLVNVPFDERTQCTSTSTGYIQNADYQLQSHRICGSCLRRSRTDAIAMTMDRQRRIRRVFWRCSTARPPHAGQESRCKIR